MTTTHSSHHKGDPEIDLFDLTLMELSTKASPLMIENLRRHLENVREDKSSSTTLSSEIIDCCLLRLNQSMLLQDVLAMCYLINGGIVLSHHQSPSTTARPPTSPSSTSPPHPGGFQEEEDLTSFEKMLESVCISSNQGSDHGRLGEISPR